MKNPTRHKKTQLDDLIPLTPRMLHVMLALSDGARHGYAIMEEVEECSGGRVRVGPGTLYEALQSLEKKSLVEVVPNKPGDDPRRRYHKLTPRGRKVLQAEANRLSDLMRVLKAKKTQIVD
jgi:DNA-binding PadR family transcriptional regulator